MNARGEKYFRHRAIEELHKAQAAISADLRALHVRWSNYYSDRLARLNGREGDRKD